MLAENPRTQVGARIKRASAVAQREATQLVGRDIEQLKRLYQQAARDIKARILAHQNVDGVLTIDVLGQLMDGINQRLTTLSDDRNGLLVSGIQANAETAIKPFIGEAAISANLAQVAHEAVQFVQSFVAADGLQLSDRLWRLDRGAREVVGEAIQSAIIQGSSATQAAEDFLSRGQAVPPEIVKKMRSAQAEPLGRVPGRALMRGEMSAYHQAERVFRTEINRAHIKTYQESAFSHPDVVGTKFLLSPRHPRTDICDLHASANLYGLGPGVYPEGKSPLPAHPNTLSYEVVVFRDEVTKADRKGKQSRIAWLKKQSTKDQISILGVNKAWALKAGHLKSNQISTPWKVLKKRYESAGIKPPAGLASVPASKVATATSNSKAVSAAFDIQGYKQIADEVLGIIDRIHDDGILPIIPIKRSRSRRYFGAYYRTRFGNDAIDIRLSDIGDHKELTLTHEIGHFIDHQGLPEAGMSSEFSQQLDGWRNAVLASPEIKRLESNRKRHHNNHDLLSYNSYLLRRREIWARSYAQWIATKSGDRKMRTQLTELVNTDKPDLPTQWQDDHFKPIADEIDKLFTKLGWLKNN